MQKDMQTLGSNISVAFWQAMDMILPPRCVVTGDMVERQGMVSPRAWAALDFIARPFCDCCGFPFEFESDPGALCAGCLDNPPPYTRARSALRYNDASRSLILGFKHGDRTHAVLAFTPWLKRAGEEILGDADMLIPVPLHRWRLIARRYNQSALIAQELARATGIDVRVYALTRKRATPSQGHLRAGERFKNVRNAFIVSESGIKFIRGKRIVLVDDVYTTGATVRECSKALLKAGAARVDVLTLARVTRNGLS